MELNDKRQLAAIIFTDIVGYTNIMEKDEQVALGYLKRKREIIYPLVAANGGKVLKEIGDAMLIKFGSAIQAVRCAIEIQKAFKLEKEFSLRIGAHLGDVVIQQEDVFGSGVNIASRLHSLAVPGGICISGDVWRQVRNQPDFSAVSLGAKKLKGIDEPIEVYELVFEAQEKQISLVQDLYDRRFFHVLVGYFLVAGILLWGTGFLISYFILSPHLYSLMVLLILLFLPAVLNIGYRHGRRGIPWTSLEKIGIFINLLMAVFVLLALFHSKDLGAATTQLLIKDEEGRQLEFVLPKAEFRKSLALFPFVNGTRDAGWDWLQFGAADMLEYDLLQDLFMDPKNGYEIYGKLRESGISLKSDLPFPLKRKLAQELHADYFVTGSFMKQDDEFNFKAMLYSTRTGHKISEKSFREVDIFRLGDQLSLHLKRELRLPERYLAKVKDRPLSESFTNSVSAFRHMVQGKMGLYLDHEGNAAALRELELAVREDPSFGLAYYQLARGYQQSAQTGESVRALQQGLPYSNRLPARLNFALKADYYYVSQDGEKARALEKVREVIFFEDVLNRGIYLNRQSLTSRPIFSKVNAIMGHEKDASTYLAEDQLDRTISEYRKILALDPSQHDYLYRIGALYEQKGNNEEAIHYYRQFAEQIPGEFAFVALGRLYRNLGQYEQAKGYYEEGLKFVPGENSLVMAIADLEVRLGNLDQAAQKYQEALGSGDWEQRMQVYQALESVYEMKGEMASASGYMRLKLTEAEKNLSPTDIFSYQIDTVIHEIRQGKRDEALKFLKDLETRQLPPLNLLISVGYLAAYAEMGDLRNAEKTRALVESLDRQFPLEKFHPLILDVDGKIHESKEEYEAAIVSYRKKGLADPLDLSTQIEVGRCYRKLKEFNKAEAALQILLKQFPFQPEAQYEIALVYSDMGDQKKAVEHLKTALAVWKDADPEFVLAGKAKEKLAIWETR